jgi:hypothetical protein
MAWEAVEFRDRHGNLVSEETRQTLLKLIEKALGTPTADPSVVINAAANVCAKIGEIRNFRAYANRSIFRAVRQGYVAECKEQAIMQPLSGSVGDLADRTLSSETVEQQILIDELLSTLSAIDREIYVRHLNGQTFPAIDEALSLKPRTSEYRFREAQSRIRKALAARPPR